MPTQRNKLTWHVGVKPYPARADAQAIMGQVKLGIITNPGTGGNKDHDYSVVPAGEIWMIQIIICSDLSSIANHLLHDIRTNGSGVNINYLPNPGISEYLKTFAPLVLNPGDFIRCRFGGVTAGDWLTSSIHGWTTPVY
jgi:hypothetical protein